MIEYWGNNEWEWDRLSHLLPADILIKILALRVNREESGDNLYWAEISSG